MVAIATPYNIGCHIEVNALNTLNKINIMMKTAAPFEITDKYEVTFIGDPS